MLFLDGSRCLALAAGLLVLFMGGCSRSQSERDLAAVEGPAINTALANEANAADQLAAVAALNSDPARTTNLPIRYTVETGQIYRMEMFKDQVTEVTIMGQTNPTRRLEAIEGTWEIIGTNVYREMFNARFTFDRVRFAEYTNKGAVGYDSATDEEAPNLERAWILSRMVGQSIEVTITPSGRIVDLRGGDALRAHLMVDGPAERVVNDVQAQERLREEITSDEALAVMLETYLATLPGTNFPIGASWTELRPLPQFRSINERRILVDKRNDDGTITVQRESVMKPQSEGVAMGRQVSEMMSFQIDSGAATTISKIMESTGWVKEAATSGTTQSRIIMKALETAELPRPPMTSRERVFVRLLGDGVEPMANFMVGEDVQ
jgi:hypothetical protein